MMVKVQKQISVLTKQLWESVLPFPKQGQFGVQGLWGGEGRAELPVPFSTTTFIPHPSQTALH